MSRVGRAPIPVPDGVQVAIDDRHVTVVGPGGSLERTLPEGVSILDAGGKIEVSRANDERRTRALHGLSRALVANMVTGVTSGYTKELEIVGVGYRATAKGPHQLDLALGFSHPVAVTAPEGVSFEVPAPTRILVRGIDKEKVGQAAADIRRLRKPEPYKGKGIRYAGEKVTRKAGKAAK